MKAVIISAFFVIFINPSTNFASGASTDWQEVDLSQTVSSQELFNYIHKFEYVDQLKSVQTRNRRIFGGKEAVPHSHPYQVAVKISSGVIASPCGGSILHERAILTAGHCVWRWPRVWIIAGVHNFRQNEPSQQRFETTNATVRVHPNWSPYRRDDIAIVILPQRLVYNNKVQPIRLPIGFEHESFIGETARVIGWGGIGNGDQRSDVLRVAYNVVVSNQECLKQSPRRVNPNTICTKETDQGACSGDSGGSLTLLRPGDSRPIIIGVASFGGPICGNQGYGGYERVTALLDWITKNQKV